MRKIAGKKRLERKRSVRYPALFLAAVLAFSLCACGETGGGNGGGESTQSTQDGQDSSGVGSGTGQGGNGQNGNIQGGAQGSGTQTPGDAGNNDDTQNPGGNGGQTAGGNGGTEGGGNQTGAAGTELSVKPEIELYGLKTARFFLDVSNLPESDFMQEYRIFFDMDGKTCCVQTHFQKNQDTFWDYGGSGNLRAVNAEKTEFESYEYASYANNYHYDEETKKLCVEVDGLLNGSFPDLKEFTVRYSYFTDGKEQTVEKTFAASEVTRIGCDPAEKFLYVDDGDGGIVITSFVGEEQRTIVFPKEIDGKPVTKIGTVGSDVIENICIPGSTESIYVPEGVKTIGRGAFGGCTSLKEVVLPEGLVSIEYGAFESNYELQTVNLPSTLTYLGEVVFRGCARLTGHFTIPGAVGTIPYGVFAESGVKSVTLMEGITRIEGGAFKESELERIDLPESLTYIGDGAFQFANVTGVLRLPKNLSYLGESAFWSCDITAVVIPDGITVLNGGVFSGCANLKDVTIPNSVTEIESSAFAASGLERIVIPDSVTTLGTYVFRNCRELVDVYVPDSVTRIGGMSFAQCYKLKSIVLPSGVSLGKDMFWDSPTVVSYR